MTKKVFLLTTIGDFAERRGPLNRLDMLITYFLEKGCKVSIISIAIHEPATNVYLKCKITWVAWDWIDALTAFKNFLLLKPMTISLFQRRHLNLDNADAVCFHLIRAVQLRTLHSLSSRIYLDYCEDLSTNFYQRANTLGTFSFKRYMMLLEANLLARFYKRFKFHVFETVFVISEYEKKVLKNVKSTVISPQRKVKRSHLQPSDTYQFKNLFFLGHLDYEPNLDALLKFCDLIQQTKRTAKFHIVGRVNEKNRARFENYTFVKLYGYVDKPHIVAQECDLGIAYLYIGTGTQNKVFDYLDFGLPILASETVYQGLDHVTKKDVIVAKDIFQFIQQRVV